MLGTVHADDLGAEQPRSNFPPDSADIEQDRLARDRQIQSKARARAAAIEVISVPESTRNVTGLQIPFSSRIRRSSSARSTRSPVAHTFLLSNGTSRCDMIQGCPILMVRSSS